MVERSGFIESRHIGSAVVLSADGQVVTELGDIAAPVFARSTLKPLQALAAMQAGVPLRGAQVAIACGSHVGSLDHMDVVEGMLKAAGVTRDRLPGAQADWPARQEPPDLAGVQTSERAASRGWPANWFRLSMPRFSGPARRTAGTRTATLSRTIRCSSGSAP